MSSSPNSSSSSNLAIVDDAAAGAAPGPFDTYREIRIPVNVVLGTGTISVRRCLALERSSVVRLQQSAGEDLVVVAKGVNLARGEVVVVEDSTSIRLTEISRCGANASSPERTT